MKARISTTRRNPSPANGDRGHGGGGQRKSRSRSAIGAEGSGRRRRKSTTAALHCKSQVVRWHSGWWTTQASRWCRRKKRVRCRSKASRRTQFRGSARAGAWRGRRWPMQQKRITRIPPCSCLTEGSSARFQALWRTGPVYPGEMPASGTPLISIRSISPVSWRAGQRSGVEGSGFRQGGTARHDHGTRRRYWRAKVIVGGSPAVNPNTTTVEIWVEVYQPNCRGEDEARRYRARLHQS